MTRQRWRTPISDSAEVIGAPPNDISALPVERWSDRINSPSKSYDATSKSQAAIPNDLDNAYLRDRMNALARELNSLRPPDAQIVSVFVMTGNPRQHAELTVECWSDAQLEATLDEDLTFEDFASAPGLRFK